LPASLRKRKRSRSPPSTATASPPSSAAIHKFGTNLRIETPRYAPSMKSAPWVRFAIRMSPKMSEKPDESRNSSPPRARLFSVWMTQNCMRLPRASGLARGSERGRYDSRFFAGGESRVYGGGLRDSSGLDVQRWLPLGGASAPVCPHRPPFRPPLLRQTRQTEFPVRAQLLR